MLKPDSEQNDTAINPDFIGYNKFSWSTYTVGKTSKTLVTRIILACYLLVSSVMISLTVLAYIEIKRYKKYNYYIKGLAISFVIGLLNVIYKELAARFVIWENHKYLKDKDRSFMLKIVIFSTINTNLPIIYAIFFPDVRAILSKPEITEVSKSLQTELGTNAAQTYVNIMQHRN